MTHDPELELAAGLASLGMDPQDAADYARRSKTVSLSPDDALLDGSGGNPVVAEDIEDRMRILEPFLHRNTVSLVRRFAVALLGKLRNAELKYGYSDGWAQESWEAECQRQLTLHVLKGDPLDVAAYAAFCWQRGWRTSTQIDGGWRAIGERPVSAIEGLMDFYGTPNVRLRADGIVEVRDWPVEVTTEARCADLEGALRVWQKAFEWVGADAFDGMDPEGRSLLEHASSNAALILSQSTGGPDGR